MSTAGRWRVGLGGLAAALAVAGPMALGAAAPTGAATAAGPGAVLVSISAPAGSYLAQARDASRGILVLAGPNGTATLTGATGTRGSLPVAQAARLLGRTAPVPAVLVVRGGPRTVLMLSGVNYVPGLGLTARAAVAPSTAEPLLEPAAKGAAATPPGRAFGAAELVAHGSYGISHQPDKISVTGFKTVSTGDCWIKVSQATWQVRVTYPDKDETFQSAWLYLHLDQWGPAVYATSCEVPSGQQEHVSCTGQPDLGNLANVTFST